MASIQALREEKSQLVQQIAEATKNHAQLTQRLSNEIANFQTNSKNNLAEMSQKVLAQTTEANSLIADLTTKYEIVLKEQIQLLTQNQKLVKRRDEQEVKFKAKIEEISKNYEKKIEEVERHLKENMSKVADLQGPRLIRILLKNQKFREEIVKRGGNINNVIQKTEQEAIYKKINEKQQQIKQLQKSNEQIDLQVTKMQEMMQTFNQLLENMKLERVNLQQQNAALSEKLKASRLMLMKLMGKAQEQ